MRTLIIANPLAGTSGHRWRLGPPPLDQLRAGLDRLDFGFDLHLTRGPGDASEVAHVAAARGYELVVAAGGDGTVHEVVNGLAGTDTMMGLVPLGTENVLAREMGVPNSIERSCQHLIAATPSRMDLGLCGDHYFACFAGIGFDGFVAAGLDTNLKDAIGSLAYVWAALERVAEYKDKNRRLELVADGRTLPACNFWQLMVGNIKAYGGNLRPTPRAKIDDGLLDVVILPSGDYPAMMHQVVAAATGNHVDLPGVTYLQVKEIRVNTEPAEKIQLDGDLHGHTPATIRVAPGALRTKF